MKNNWQTKKLEDCLEKVDYTNKIQRKDFLESGVFPIVSQEQDSINGFWNNKQDLFKVNTPLVIFGDHTQVLKYIDFDFVLGADGVKILRPKKFLESKFFYYFLQSVNLKSLGYARHYRLLKEIEVSYPESLPEQQRIVAILDKVFEKTTKGKENVEKNLQNARELFESYLQSIFANPGDGWEKVKLLNLLERGWITSHLDGNHGGEYPRKEEFKKEGVPYISANCLKGDIVDLALAKFLSPGRAAFIRKGVAINKDVLFAHNATVGPVALLKTKEPKVILGTSLTYYRCNPKYILPEYLIHYMRSGEFKLQYELIMRQSTRNQVQITKPREFYHVIPPLNEQNILIQKLDVLFAETKKLESIYQQRLTDLDELKKSILQKAFAGELAGACS